MAVLKKQAKNYKTPVCIHRLKEIWDNKTRAQQRLIKAACLRHFAESKFYTILDNPHKQFSYAVTKLFAKVFNVPMDDLFHPDKPVRVKKSFVSAGSNSVAKVR